MRERLQSLRLILKQGYLLTDKKEEYALEDIISTLEHTISASSTEIEVDYQIFSMARIRQLLSRKQQDPVFTDIYNKFSHLFNEALQQLTYHHKKQIQFYHDIHTHHSQLIPLEYIPYDAKNSITHRISLVNSYKQLMECKNCDITPQRTYPSDLIFDEIRRTLEGHNASHHAYNGLHLIEMQFIPLSSQISLRKILQLVWSLIPKDADKAKKALCEVLEKIDNEFSSIKNTLDYQKIFELLLQPLTHINNYPIYLLHSINDITLLIKKKCNEYVKEFLAKEPLSEQSKILYHLEKKESVKDHLGFNIYIEETIALLEKEFSIYGFVVPNIPNLVKQHVDSCLSEISLDWLRGHSKEGLRRKLEEISDATQKKEVLLKAITYEIETCNNNERIALFQLIYNRTKTLIPSQQGVIYQQDSLEIHELHNRYKEILLLDDYHRELNAIIQAQKKSANQFIYLPLAHQASLLLKQFSYATFMKTENRYQIKTNPYFKLMTEKTLISYGQPWALYHKTMPSKIDELEEKIESLKSQKKLLDGTLTENKKQENDIFSHFNFPSSYIALEKNSLVKSISALFQDYVDKAHWYYFHAYRHHVKEAKEIIRVISELKTPLEIRAHLTAIKDTLLARNQINIEGSFLKRMQYCLQTLLPDSPRPALKAPSPRILPL